MTDELAAVLGAIRRRLGPTHVTLPVLRYTFKDDIQPEEMLFRITDIKRVQSDGSGCQVVVRDEEGKRDIYYSCTLGVEAVGEALESVTPVTS